MSIWLWIGTVLAFATLFLNHRNNLLHAIQLTNITARFTLFYVFLFVAQWSDKQVWALRPFHSLVCFFCLCILLVQETYLTRSVVAEFVLLLIPNFVIFHLLEWHWIYFRHFSTLLFFLHIVVVVFFWGAIFLGDESDSSQAIRFLLAHPRQIF